MTELERMMIERECQRLVTEYTHLVDSGQASRIPDLFTEDGSWSSPFNSMTGEEELRAGFTARQSMARASKHVCTNLQLEIIDDDHVEGVVYLTLYNSDTEQSPAPLDGPTLVGRYRDTFRRTDDGWRFHTRVTEVDFLRT